MKRILFILFLILGAKIVAQTNLFSKRYENNNAVRSYAIIQAKDSGFIYVGQQSNRAAVTKIDSGGNVVWIKQYAISGAAPKLFNICRTSDSCYAVVGNYNNQDVLCMKLKENGDTIWVKGIPAGGTVSGIQHTKDKGYIITSSDGLAVLTKLDSMGNLLWRRRLNLANHSNYGITAKELPDSSYVLMVTRETNNSSVFMGHTTLINISKVGIVNWAKFYNRAVQIYNWGFDMLVVSDGILIFANIYSSYGLGLLKTDFSGNVIWCTTYNLNGTSNLGTFPKIKKATDGGFIFGMERIIKVNSIGQPIWTNTWTVPQPVAPQEIIETKDKGILAISNFFGSNFTDQTFIIKLDSLGNTPACSNTVLVAYTLDAFIATSITPTVFSTGNIINQPVVISTASVNMTSGCIPIYPWGINEQIKNGIDLELSPNPSDGVFNITTNEICSYVVTDGVGKLITRGNCNMKGLVDISNEANGVYILQVKDQFGKTLDSRKLIKNK